MNTVQIVQKPDNVAWSQIKDCISRAHESNMAHGIIMAHTQWSADQIRDFIDGKGVMYVAMDEDRVVGTLGIVRKVNKPWFVSVPYGYLCFGCLSPSYRGQGLYGSLNKACEEYAMSQGFDVIVLDTHSKNAHMQDISLRGGFRRVFFFRARSGDHFCVLMAKWLTRCPYSELYRKWKYLTSKIRELSFYFVSKMVHR